MLCEQYSRDALCPFWRDRAAPANLGQSVNGWAITHGPDVGGADESSSVRRRTEGRAMSECPECAEAQTRRTHAYRNGCRQCEIRAFAEGPEFDEAERLDKVTREYRRAMLISFGDDWQTVHLAVKAEALRIAKL